MTLHLVTGRSGEPHVTSMDAGRFNALTIGEGRYIINGCNAAVVDSNTISIANGDMLIDGRHVSVEGTGETVTIENGQSGYNRIDLICLHYERGEGGIETVTFRAIKGTPTASTPSAPAAVGSILNGDITADIALYSVTINGTAVGAPKLFIEPRLPKVNTLELGTAIPANSNLNDYTIPGVYYTSSASVTASLSNCPIVNEGITLVVRAALGKNSVTQTVIGWADGVSWSRGIVNGTAYNWAMNGGIDSISSYAINPNDNDWSWIKWASGACIAWKVHKNSMNAIVNVKGGLYMGYPQTLSYPFNIYYPSVVLTGFGSIDGWRINTITETNASITPFSGERVASSEYTYGTAIVAGRWK